MAAVLVVSVAYMVESESIGDLGTRSAGKPPTRQDCTFIVCACSTRLARPGPRFLAIKLTLSCRSRADAENFALTDCGI